MISYDQLAKKAYQAFQKEFFNNTKETTVAWEEMPDALKASWLAAAKQLWAEFSVIR